MSTSNLRRTLPVLTTALSLIPLLLQGSPARAQTWLELGAGATQFTLKPAAGGSLNLRGAFVTGRIGASGPWSLETRLGSETGTDINESRLRQWNLQAGPRYTLPVCPGLAAFAHVLAGASRLEATQGLATDRTTSAVLSPGLGLDLRLGSHVALRGVLDEALTRYAGRTQRNLALGLGVAFRWSPSRPVPPVPSSAAPAPIPVPVVAPAPIVAAPPAPVPPPAPEPRPEPLARVVVEELRLNYGPGKAKLDEPSLAAIRRLADSLKRLDGPYALTVTGHTSRIGLHNQKLSERRARIVAAALEAAGVPSRAITVRAVSFREPLVPNDTLANRARNRRVEATVAGEGATRVEVVRLKRPS